MLNWELEDVEMISLSYRWEKEKNQPPKLVIETKLRMLETLTAKDEHEGKLTKDQIRQALNEHLKDFLGILKKNRAKTQEEEDGIFTLTRWIRDQMIGKVCKNIAIMGEPGAGKTTWLQQIVRY